MGTELFPNQILKHYEVYEWNHACAILKNDYPVEWDDLIEFLSNFRLKKSSIAVPGGSKSDVAKKLENFLAQRGWIEKSFDTKIIVDQTERKSPTHKVDCYKNNIALEIEWNNKDTFFDRDLNNFRLLFDLRVVSAGIIITRCDELQDIFRQLGKGKSSGASTTHISKLLPKINGGGSGGCPLLVFGIKSSLFVED
jgi:hypothetical protein